MDGKRMRHTHAEPQTKIAAESASERANETRRAGMEWRRGVTYLLSSIALMLVQILLEGVLSILQLRRLLKCASRRHWSARVDVRFKPHTDAIMHVCTQAYPDTYRHPCAYRHKYTRAYTSV